MTSELNKPHFQDANKAREYLEAQVWPAGKQVCPHCGVIGEHYTLKGIAEVITGVLVVSPPICGDVEPDPCQLANDITPP